jgi:dTDP-4-dehydrorhamnose 3,5-epimerase
MEVIKNNFEGVLVITTKKYTDDRGVFYENFRDDIFNKAVNTKIKFLQENESISKRNVIRGLHYQSPPYAQGKLVRVIQGAVIDVIVDIRKNSITYGKTFKIELSSINGLQLWIPEGFAHGFMSLEDNTVLNYKCTSYYNKESENAILWNDETLKIEWNNDSPILSEKDRLAPSFNVIKSPF